MLPAQGKRGHGVTDKLHVVFDCNVLLQATAWEKSVAAKCLNGGKRPHQNLCKPGRPRRNGKYINRPEIRTHFQDLSDEIVGEFLKRLWKISVLVHPVPKKFGYPATKTMGLISILR
jgi:hypothetical protein